MRKTKVGNFIVIIIFKFDELVAAWLQREWEKKILLRGKFRFLVSSDLELPYPWF